MWREIVLNSIISCKTWHDREANQTWTNDKWLIARILNRYSENAIELRIPHRA